MKKQRIFLSILVFFLTTAFSMANDGCYMDPASVSYCSSISPEQAQEECLLSEGCVLDRVFFEGKECSLLPECDLILCKSSCNPEKRGQCSGGELAALEKSEWCSSGCCVITYGQDFTCLSEESKWHCQVAAFNSHASSFSFQGERAEGCNTLCSNGVPSSTFSFEKTPLSLFAERKVLFANSSGLIQNRKVIDQVQAEQSDSSIFSTFLGPVFIALLIVGGGILFFWLWFKRSGSSEEREVLEEGAREEKEGDLGGSSSFLNSLWNKKKKERRHKHTVAEHEKTLFKLESHLPTSRGEMIPTSSHFNRLSHLILKNPPKKQIVERRNDLFAQISEKILLFEKKKNDTEGVREKSLQSRSREDPISREDPFVFLNELSNSRKRKKKIRTQR